MTDEKTYPVVRFTVRGKDRDSAELEDAPYTLVYDGACRVCGYIVRFLKGWDRRDLICMVPSQAAGVREKFPWIPEHAYAESVQLIGPGGRTWQGADAFRQILHILPGGGFFAWIFRLPGVPDAAERFYRWFARNRYKLGCGRHCEYRPYDLNLEQR
jgi:predicted DCC family thiol-disulfide oxidoreductase YuxK